MKGTVMVQNSELADELNQKILENKLKGKSLSIGNEIYLMESADSTNRVCKEIGSKGGSHGLVVLAKEQTAGRGRIGRGWLSKKNEGIYMSILLHIKELPIDKVSLLTLIAALAVQSSIEKETALLPRIKWPNDIVLNGKKVTGILTEMNSSNGGNPANAIAYYVVVGIGINVKGEDFSGELATKATSLKHEMLQLKEGVDSKYAIDMNSLVATILERFDFYFNQFKSSSKFPFLEEYNKKLINKDNVVRIIEKEEEYRGIALGINEKGALLVKKENNQIVEIMSGEVSVRGVYGYV